MVVAHQIAPAVSTVDVPIWVGMMLMLMMMLMNHTDPAPPLPYTVSRTGGSHEHRSEEFWGHVG